ncbi:MAG: leucine-rich repeat domain-containing protein [Bacteroidaceae bacterium]|nr:leucine-rich repeat domain-containing protein [Bacteroidaceae bacterium]
MKKILLFYLFLLLPFLAFASPVQIGNLFYELSSTDKTAEVTSPAFEEGVTDIELVIPDKVSYDGVTYQVTKIGESAFYGCWDVTSITLPSSIKEIGNFAFQDCQIESINLPAGLKKIGNCAFRNVNLQSIDIPSSVTEMGSAVFLDCFYDIELNITDLKAWCNISFEGTLRGIMKLFLNGKEVTHLVIPDGVKEVKACSFGEFVNIESVEIPQGVEKIGDYAFYADYELTSITIPKSVTSIGEYAFWYCEKLSSLTIPSSVKEIGGNAFWNCSGISDLVLPEGVEKIGENAFGGSGVTTVKLPNSLKKVGDYAFQSCTHLLSVTIPKGLTEIGYEAFTYSQMNAIVVDPANSVYDSRNNCNALIETATNTLLAGCKNTVIPNTVTAIGDGAFSNCRFTSIQLPYGIKSIGSSAFESCIYLASLSIPASVESIGASAFYNCQSLKSIAIPEGVSLIPQGMCSDCLSLKTIILPSTITVIQENPFPDGVKDMFCYAVNPPKREYDGGYTIIPVYPDGKGDIYVPTTLHVPAVALDNYKTTELWKIFQEIVPLTEAETAITNTNADNADEEDGWCTLNGVKLNGKPTQKGIYLYNGKKVAVQ